MIDEEAYNVLMNSPFGAALDNMWIALWAAIILAFIAMKILTRKD